MMEMLWIRIKQMSSVIAMAIGGLGTILSVQACRYSWSTAKTVSAAAEETFLQLDAAAGSVYEQSKAAESIVVAVSDRVRDLRVSFDEIAEEGENDPQVPPTYLKVLDEELLRRLDAAEEFFLTMQDTLRNTGSALLVLDSLHLFSSKLSLQAVRRETQLQTLASNLAELSDLMERTRQLLTEIRPDSSIDPRHIRQIQKAFTSIEQRLYELKSEAMKFSERAGRFKARAGELRIAVAQHVERLLLLTTTFFVCFACSQLGLMAYAWGTLTKRIPEKSSEVSGATT
jgi:hypothetical protein